jgi:membrane protease YdiL (CAAX protease family)
MSHPLLADLGLSRNHAWLRDPWPYAAALAAVPVTLALRAAIGEAGDQPTRNGLFLVSFILWQPLIEELLFRGVIQGQLRTTRPGRWQKAGITGANLISSLFFVLAHTVNHSPLWAIAVFVPSLVFGFMRDRHDSIYPGLVLHCAYNGLYLLAGLP